MIFSQKNSKADIQQLGMGILKHLSGLAEQDLGCEFWNDLAPHANEFVRDLFPKQHIEINPLLNFGFKIFESIDSKRRNTLIEQAKQKALELQVKKLGEISNASGNWEL